MKLDIDETGINSTTKVELYSSFPLIPANNQLAANLNIQMAQYSTAINPQFVTSNYCPVTGCKLSFMLLWWLTFSVYSIIWNIPSGTACTKELSNNNSKIAWNITSAVDPLNKMIALRNELNFKITQTGSMMGPFANDIHLPKIVVRGFWFLCLFIPEYSIKA